MSYRYIIFIAMVGLVYLAAPLLTVKAQNNAGGDGTGITPGEIEVVKDFAPILADAVRYELNPDLPGTSGTGSTGTGIKPQRPVFNDYDVPSRMLTLSYKPNKIEALTFSEDGKSKNRQASKVELYNVWLKAGYGNLKTPIADLALTTKQNKSVVAGLRAHHIQSEDPNVALKDYARTGGQLYVHALTNGLRVAAEGIYNRNRNYYYGYNHIDTALNVFPSQVRQTWQTIGGGISIENAIENSARTDFLADIHYFNTSDKLFDVTENNIEFKATTATRLGNNMQIGIFTNLLHASTGTPGLTFNATPNFLYRNNIIEARGGVTVFKDDAVGVFPDIRLQLNLVSTKLALFGNWYKNVRMNTLQSISAQNWFIAPSKSIDYQLLPTTIQTREGGLKGTVGLVDYRLLVAQTLNKQQELIINQQNQPHFLGLTYDSMLTNLTIRADLGIALLKKVNCMVYAGWHKYETTSQQQAWHLPTLEAGLSLVYKPISKLHLQADAFMADGAKALQPDGNIFTIKTLKDVNIGLKYQISKNFGLFAQVNNLTNQRQVLYLNYKSYGLNATGGLLLRF